MSRLWAESEEELLMECIEKNMTLREITNLFNSNGSDRTYKSIEYKRSKIQKTWAYEHDNGKEMPASIATVLYPDPVKAESVTDWFILSLITMGAIIMTWWYIS